MDRRETPRPDATAPRAAVGLERTYERYHREVFKLALRYGGGRVSWAEDVTHDVFLKLLAQPQELSEPDALGGWFYRVTTRRCLNRLRHEAFVRSAPVRWILGTRQIDPQTPEAFVLVQAELRAVGLALQALPPKEQVAFCMLHIDAVPQTEIARILGYSRGYVSKLITRATARLAAAGWEIEP